MPTTASFTSLYDDTVDEDLGNGFSVKLRKFLSEADFRAAGGALVRNRRYKEAGSDVEITGDFDAFSYNRTLVERAIVSWNLTKDNPKGEGDPIAIPVEDFRRGKYDLPQPVFRQILDRVLTLNKEAEVSSAKEDADFRGTD